MAFDKDFRRETGQQSENGFTLIELLIVIVVLGILAAVVVFALGSVTSKSGKAACAADAKTVETAIAAQNAQSGSYPAAGTDTNALAITAGTVPTYLKSWPSNSADYFIGVGMSASPIAGEIDIAPGNTTGTPPAAGATWVNYDTESSGTGCNAVT